MTDYTLLTLECWSCPEKFAVFTDLSTHHLECHERHLRGESVTTWMAAWLAQDVTPGEMDTVEACESLCFCGHAEDAHPQGTWRMPCRTAECPCDQFTAAATSLSALETFVGRCRAEGLHYDTFDARLLLDTLGVPPDAPAVEWEAGMSEALQRWRDRVTAPAPPPRRMSNDIARGNPYHYGEHVENGYCATAGCQPIEETSVGEEPAPLPRLMYNPMERWGWRHHGEHAENGYCATAQCIEKKGGETHP